MIAERKKRFVSSRAGIMLCSVFLFGCSWVSTPAPDISKGSSKDEVVASLGEPDEIQDFILPDQPFFGPQESLANLVPAGSTIEEWVYVIGDEVIYVWFTGEIGDDRETWLVIEIGRYPKDAVY